MPSRRTSAMSVNHHTADDTLIGRGTVTFAAGDDSTTEKTTAAISLLDHPLPQDHRIAVCLSRTEDATGGTMTAKVYVQCKIDGTTAENCLAGSGSVENVSGARGVEILVFNVGAGVGDGTITLGFLFAGNGGAITVRYAVYPV